MNRFALGVVCFAVLAIAFCFVGSGSVSATRADPSKGTGCYVRVGEDPNDYVFDATCSAHDVLKLDDDGTLDFYVYQDHAQTSWHPETAYRSTFEACFNFDFGVVCGTAKETVTPSGEYKSSFKSY
jgi:hypothetical protein